MIRSAMVAALLEQGKLLATTRRLPNLYWLFSETFDPMLTEGRRAPNDR